MKERRRLQKGLLAIMCICLTFVLSSTTMTMAAPISTLKITVVGNENFEYPTVEVRDSRYEITEQTAWNKAEEELVLGDKISCTITVEPIDGNKFILNDEITIKGAEKENVVKKDGSYNITISYVVAGKLEVPQEVWWNSNEPWIVETEEISGATKYEFELWQADKLIKTVRSNRPSYNFAKELATVFKQSNVKAKVRAVCETEGVRQSKTIATEKFEYWGDLQEYCNRYNISVSSNGKHIRDDDINYDFYSKIVTDEKETQGQWKGGPGNWCFQKTDRSYATGKIMYQGNIYYLQEDGKMATGEVTIDGRKYYFNDGIDSKKPEGAALIGLCSINGNEYWYYRKDGTTDMGYSYKAGEKAKNVWIRLENRSGENCLKLYFDESGKCTQEQKIQ